ncbi:hypothetical protein A1355_11915 [Methylomonas koyamae]|uniref:Uncharacterized protein n=1 Tax=Methylomonas koyamae TaxID=702114 RepID=A0A177NAT0_9GAMM|nr:hypothetical protein A1355_11915 [Methylomonas koyamae]
MTTGTDGAESPVVEHARQSRYARAMSAKQETFQRSSAIRAMRQASLQTGRFGEWLSTLSDGTCRDSRFSE